MKRRIFVLVLAFLVAFAMMPAMGFAASKVVLKTEKVYEKHDGNWIITNDYAYNYNKKGKETKHTYESFQYYEEEGVNNSYGKDTYWTAYDSKGRVKQTITHWSGFGYNKSVYTYTTKNRVKKIKHYYKRWSKNSYKYDGYTIYYYASKKITINTYDADGKIETKTINTLNSKGRVKTSKSYSYYDGEKTLDNTTTFTYHTNGQVKTEKSVGNVSTFIYTYNKSGKLKKEERYWDEEYETITYSYDSYGRLIKEKTVGWGYSDSDDGSYSSVTRYKYSGYFKKHKYPKKRFAYWNGGEKAFEKVVYTYKSIG